VLGGEYCSWAGGKGANQAVGLAKLGSPTVLLSKVGNDHYGQQILAYLSDQGLDVSEVEVDSTSPTGLALITLDSAGTRTIVVSPGANKNLSEADVDRVLDGAPQGSIVLTQLEIPLGIVEHLLRLAKRHGLHTIMHASPAVPLPREVLRLADVLVLNQSELNVISGRSAQHLETAAGAAEQLLSDGVGTVLVTMRHRGVLIARQPDAWPPTNGSEQPRFVAGHKVHAAEGNVASSSFIAGLAHHLATAGDDADLHGAVRFGLAAMAVSLGRSGGQASLPTRNEVEQQLVRSQPTPGQPTDYRGTKLEELADRAGAIRRRIIRMLYAARSGHPGGSLSAVELLAVLYFQQMVYNPREPGWPNRDRLVLSKGHAAPALYATLIEAGFLEPELEGKLRQFGSPLQGHPDLKRCPGVDMSTGSLGQGLSAANGMALAARHTGRSYRVYCILGDGEVQEGQVWEAAMTAAHNHLDNLCAVVDYNALQIDGNISQVKSPIEPLADKWKAFGWHVINVDGHDLAELSSAFEQAKSNQGKPTMIVAHTIKGHGISFMEGVIEYHGSTLSEDEVKRALRELEGQP
jgi:transketolase